MAVDNSLPKDDHYRLPANVEPTQYDLAIRTDLKTLTFYGRVNISLNVVANTFKIVLHATELDLQHATVYSAALNRRQPAIFESYDEGQQRVTYGLNEMLPAGSKAELEIIFRATLSKTTRGYHKFLWEHDNSSEYYALTQLCPIDARRVFPCWDEPALKAKFYITLVSRADTVNISNMPVSSEKIIHADDASILSELTELFDTKMVAEDISEQWKITKFEVTPPMSTYGVAFANGHFEFIETSVVLPLNGTTIPIRVYTTSDLISQACYTLDVTAAVLPLYEKLLGIEYPLPKLDTFIAHNFEGAMENWGLIMATASVYLLDPKRADEFGKRMLASTQIHEISHMWFGNITTMEWWDYIYLNEGFATLMGDLLMMDKVHPEWKPKSEFLTAHLEKSMALDARISSHPVEVKTPDANNVNQVFDGLSYSKAASVLRMLCAQVGEDKFLQGVSLCLKKHLYANIVTADLWEGISVAVGFDVEKIMENWITKVGYPVLTVSEIAEGIHIRQDRFTETGIAGPDENETIWTVPLTLLSTKDGQVSIHNDLILIEREGDFKLDTTQSFKLNAESTGFYRVLYTPERLKKIATEAAKETSKFSLNDKIGLLQDAFALSKAGLASLSSCLTLVHHWKGEKQYLVWRAIANGLEELSSIWWENQGVTNKLDLFRQSLFGPIVDQLGYEKGREELIDVGLLRTLAVEQALNAGHSEVIQELRRRFTHYLDSGDDSKIPVDLQSAIFIAGVKYGGRREYDAVAKMLDKPKTALERKSALGAIASPQDPVLLEETNRYMTEKALEHDLLKIFRSLAMNFKARRLLTRYFEDNYEVLFKRMANNMTFVYLVKYCLEFYSSQKDYTKIEEFFKEKDTAKYDRSLAQALDSIHARTLYVERSTEDLLTWLDQSQQ